MKHDKKKWLNVLPIILMFVLLSGIILASYGLVQLNKIKTNKISKTDEDLGINMKEPIVEEKESDVDNHKYDSLQKVDGIVNIALFGIDTGREKNDVPHSDAIIIGTFDTKHNKLKLTSVLRDTYVKVNKHGMTKITEAYAYGGPQLAIRTLNENFGLDIRNYVTVDFFSLEKVIDKVGGIDIDIKAYEVKEINKWIDELAELENKTPTPVKKEGLQKLNGMQSVAYCRMRKVGNGDFERSDRQRRVMDEVFKKASSLSMTKALDMVTEIFPYLETSMDKTYMLKLAFSVYSSGIKEIEQQRFPLDGYCDQKTINGKWMLIPKPDINTTKKQMQDYIYKDKKTPSNESLF